jgi:hypothetical protein
MIGWMKHSRKANDCAESPVVQPGHVVTKGCLKKSDHETYESSLRLESSDGEIKSNSRGKLSLSSSMTGSRSDWSSELVPCGRQALSHSDRSAANTTPNNALSCGVQRRRVSASSPPSLASSSLSSSSWKSVSFGTVHIREYDRTVSDNPSCSSGPPIG